MAGALLEAMLQCAEEGRPAAGQNMRKGRRTAIDWINGLVAAQGEDVGIPVPTYLVTTRASSGRLRYIRAMLRACKSGSLRS